MPRLDMHPGPYRITYFFAQLELKTGNVTPITELPATYA
jgi:hypothetical protein